MLNNYKNSHLRWWLGILFFLIGLIAYMDRANLAMVAEPMMAEYGLSKVQFGLLGSFFSLGYALAQIPGGILAERFGSRAIVSISLTIWSVFTILTAVVPKYLWLCMVRFLFGVGEGPTYPSNAVFNTYWFQRKEKARAASLLNAGAYFGPVVAPLVTVWIMMHYTWHMVFFIFGAIGFVIALAWFLLARNKPEEHPLISKRELAYIQADRSIATGDTNVKAPWKLFMRQVDFWAIGIHYFLVGYMTALFLIWLPTYLQEAKGFSITHMGIAASFPWIAICSCVLLGGVFSDWLLQKGKSFMVARGALAITGLAVFIIAICGASFTDNHLLTVFWLSLALGALGFPVVASWAICADKGQKYAGSVAGWMNLWGNLGGVASPLLCGLFAQLFGWWVALMLNIVPIALAIVCWLFIKPNSFLQINNQTIPTTH